MVITTRCNTEWQEMPEAAVKMEQIQVLIAALSDRRRHLQKEKSNQQQTGEQKRKIMEFPTP